MKKSILKFFLPLVAIAFAMAACSENDDSVEEFPDWQSTNETYYDRLYATTKQKIEDGDTSWKIIRSWTLESDAATKPADYIIAHVESEGTADVKPFYTDSVRVHYSGHLLPSTSYTNGYVFDKSYTGTFYEETAVPSQFLVSGLVTGFTTALLNMNLGDRWTVYVPYQLGYGTEATSSIPAYSTLVFDIDLVGIYRAGADVPTWNAPALLSGWMMWKK
jgi:FKBP-type peptidyl-prolyl cis-trans isomerase FklB